MSRGMAPERRSEGRRSALERHVQTLLVALATAGIIWMADSASRTKETIARMDERINGIAAQVQQLNTSLAAIDAKNIDRTEADQRFRDIERRLDTLENNPRHARPEVPR